jgi:hypothetical protein
MRDWISDLLIFSAGITGGYLITNIKPYFRAAKQQRTAMVAARTRILADVKERHEEEILNEALRTTEAIRGELNQSLQTLRKTLIAVLDPVTEQPDAEQKPVSQLSKPVEPNQPTS